MPRTVRFHEIGEPEVLRLEEESEPTPGPGEVVIHTRALGLNRAESMFRRGEYGTDPVFPSGIGYEAAGIIAAVGAGVDNVTAGDAVSVVPAFSMDTYAVHGESVLAPASAVVVHPENLSFAEAAASWMPFITAYGGLIDLANTNEGDTVLIPAASSSVGIAAIQIAHMVGAKAIALTRTSEKRSQLLDAGADDVIATAEEDVVRRVRNLTDGAGARVVFDPVAGSGLSDLIDAAAQDGIIIEYGVLDAQPASVNIGAVLFKHLTIRGYELFEITLDAGRRDAAVAFVSKGLAEGKLTPRIDKTFSLDQIVEAHCHLEGGSQVGKIVIETGVTG